MKAKRYLALLLAAALALGLSACSRPSRRPALPAAPLQSTFKQDEADLGQGETASLQSAPTMERAEAGIAQAIASEQTTEELLAEFTAPLEDENALYQDYTIEHRTAYKALRAQPEAVIMLVLPELLSDVTALERYSDDTSRTTLLYCLLKDTLQNEPFSWDGDSYRYLSDMLAEFIQFVSGHEVSDGDDWFTEHAPLTGLCAAVMKAKPSLRLNMTACEPTTNAQALTNAKLVFAAALENRDAERFGFEAWEDGMADGFDFTTDWTLMQNEAGAVTLTATDPDTGEAVSLCYEPNEAERRSLLSGYGALVRTTADGETLRLPSQNCERAFVPAGSGDRVQDYEMVLENGVEIGMDYNTVLSLIGTPDKVWSDAMAGMGMASEGVSYSFLYDDRLVPRLWSVEFRFAEDTFLQTTSALPAAREIALGDSMQSVFEKIPAVDTVLKKWALQQIYGWDDPEGGTATLQFVADSFYVLDLVTPGGRVLSITFARLDNTVKWIDLS